MKLLSLLTSAVLAALAIYTITLVIFPYSLLALALATVNIGNIVDVLDVDIF